MGTEGRAVAELGFWSLKVGDRDRQLVPLDRRWYWEKPRLSSVSHGPRKEEQEERGGKEEECSG